MTSLAKWFAPTGLCQCGKPATGRLMSNRNADLGPYCAPCATRRITQAEKARENERAAG